MYGSPHPPVAPRLQSVCGKASTGSVIRGICGSVIEAEDVPPGGRLAVWRVDGCVVGGVEVRTQTVITVCAGGRAMVFDDASPPEQVLALFDALRDHLGGPDWRFIQIPMDDRTLGAMVDVSIPGRLHLVTRPGPAAMSALVADIRLSFPDEVEWRGEGVPVTVRPIGDHGGDR